MLTLIIIIAAIIIGVTIVAAVHISNASKPETKGEQGENAVIYTIKQSMQGNYYLINDIILRDKHGMTHQIDHIVINRYGVFVIETKNYSGIIYGKENENEWTQILGNEHNTLRNPVKQNMSHVYCLKNILQGVYLRPYVVFVQNNTQNIAAENVIPLSNLPYVLNTDIGQNLSDGQMQSYYKKIMSAKADITEEEHINNIYRQQTALANGICPRCGDKLVLRQRKDGTGSFYGCSSYPKCKFTKNID